MTKMACSGSNHTFTIQEGTEGRVVCDCGGFDAMIKDGCIQVNYGETNSTDYYFTFTIYIEENY